MFLGLNLIRISIALILFSFFCCSQVDLVV